MVQFIDFLHISEVGGKIVLTHRHNIKASITVPLMVNYDCCAFKLNYNEMALESALV